MGERLHDKTRLCISAERCARTPGTGVEASEAKARQQVRTGAGGVGGDSMFYF